MTTNKDELKAIFFSFYDQLKPEHAEKAKANYDEDWAPKWGEPKSHDDAVNFSCDWSKTTEGFTYWDNIHDDLMDESYPLQLTPQVCKDKAKEHLYGKDTTNSKMPAHEWFKYLKPEHKEAALTLPHDMGVDGELFECLADALYSKDWSQSDIAWPEVHAQLTDGSYHTESAESAERMATPEDLEELEERIQKATNPKDSLGTKKVPMSGMPAPVLMECGLVKLHGDLKYGRHNWRGAGAMASVYYDAAMRHLNAWWEGEDLDPDSGVHHIAHAITGLCVVRDSQMRGECTDDRPMPTKEGWISAMNETAKNMIEKHENEK